MNINKKLFYISSIIAICTFVVSLILAYNNTDNDCIINYYINIALAIFGSSVMLIVTSIWGYFNERKKYEIQYASFFRDYLLRIARFLGLYDSTALSPKEVYNTVSDIHTLYDSFAYVQNFDIDGYFFKKGCRCRIMRIVHEKAFQYSKELTRIRGLAKEACLDNKENFLFKTNISIKQLEDDKILIDRLLKNERVKL